MRAARMEWMWGEREEFVYGHRLIELEIAADGFRVEIEIIEVKVRATRHSA